VLKHSFSIFLLSSLTACGGSFASSERQVLPGFSPKELAQKRVLIAPYAASALEKDAGIPLDLADIRQIDKKYPGPNDDLVALEDFYDAGQAGAREATRETGSGASLVTVQAARWAEYFADQEQFMNVTVDGKTRYEVPERALLERLGADADIVIVLGKLGYSSWIETTETTSSNGMKSYNTSHSARCESHFLVWDYAQKRALAEGTAESEVPFGKKVDLADFEQMGSLLVAEIMDKRPFR